MVGFVLPAQLNAQAIREAKILMQKYSYAKAVEILKGALSDDKIRPEAIPLLAECYRSQRDFVNAKDMYAQAIDLPEAKPEYFYYYAQALQATGDYQNARDMFLEYAELNPSDLKGQQSAAHCDSVLGPWKQFAAQSEYDQKVLAENRDSINISGPNRTSRIKEKLLLSDSRTVAPSALYEVKLEKEISTKESDFGPAFYLGELVFASDNNTKTAKKKLYGWTGRGYLSIMKSRPVNVNDFWNGLEAPTIFNKKFVQAYHDGPASFTADGNTIYYTRSFIGQAKRIEKFKTNMLKIYSSSKVKDEWTDPKPFYLNSTDYSVGHPSISPNGQTLYFASDMKGGKGGTDIYICRKEGDSWGPAICLDSTINTSSNEMFPTIREDGVLFFASDGHPGYGGLDIFKTQFVNGHWTKPVNLQPPMNSSYDDFAIAFAPGLNSGFFSSNRPNGVGSDDIYAFRELEVIKSPPPPSIFTAIGYVKDKITLQPITDATVFLLDPTSGKVKVLKSSDDGMYTATITSKADYIVKAMKSEYISDCTPFKVTGLKESATKYKIPDLLLDQLIINKTFKINNIYYNFDKYDIREDAKPELNNLVRIMKENSITVELGSHTDSRGSDKYNNQLSQKRAESAVRYIVQQGIETSRITAKGYGETKLLNRCGNGVPCSDEEHQANRRTEFKVISISKTTSKSELDLSKFIFGEEILVNLLGNDFFINCQKDQKASKALAKTDNTPTAKDPPLQKEVTAPANHDKEVMKDAKPTGSVKYRVQLFSLSVEKSLEDPDFEGLQNVQVFNVEGKFKYTVGAFPTYEKAVEYRKEMVKKGFADSFVVSYPAEK